MNVRPNDLARIVHPKMYGHMVSVMYATPVQSNYTLPDGFKGIDGTPGTWICQSLGAPFPAPVLVDGKWTQRQARYASISDKWLRPIRDPGDDARDESHAWLPPVPTKETA